MLYQSATIWEFDWKGLPGWGIEVRYGKFNSIERAAKFGASVRGLHHLLGQNHLLLCDGTEQVHIINKVDITLRKLREESFGKLTTNSLEDLTMIELDFVEISELPKSFHSLVYGIADEDGRRLEVDGYLYFLSH
ncbi:MAG: hypothetical protein JO235_10425 [Chroococcidiopsidaceae cyanobacterium CP_BM_RX_35]|nr:hypothetical protein [Chroococcidiopsidaceae cyanobacterium CP_BM_RX_35]